MSQKKAAALAVAESFRVERVAISRLRGSDYNPRRISPDDLEALKKSIREYGLVDPIIANDRTTDNGWKKADLGLVVVGGHQRLRAATELGIASVPVVVLSLTEKREKVLNLALNNVGGDFDTRALAVLLKDLSLASVDLGPTGFNDQEIKALVARMDAEMAPPASFPQAEGKLTTTYQCPSCGFEWSGKPRPA